MPYQQSHYTLSHLENDHDVSAYSGERRLSSRAQLAGCVLQRVSLGALSGVTVVLGMRQSIGFNLGLWFFWSGWSFLGQRPNHHQVQMKLTTAFSASVSFFCFFSSSFNSGWNMFCRVWKRRHSTNKHRYRSLEQGFSTGGACGACGACRTRVNKNEKNEDILRIATTPYEPSFSAIAQSGKCNFSH